MYFHRCIGFTQAVPKAAVKSPLRDHLFSQVLESCCSSKWVYFFMSGVQLLKKIKKRLEEMGERSHDEAALTFWCIRTGSLGWFWSVSSL